MTTQQIQYIRPAYHVDGSIESFYNYVEYARTACPKDASAVIQEELDFFNNLPSEEMGITESRIIRHLQSGLEQIVPKEKIITPPSPNWSYHDDEDNYYSDDRECRKHAATDEFIRNCSF